MMYWKSYHDVLQNVFSERRARNPSYSMRAFARDLGFSISRMSGIMRRRFGISPESAERVSWKLGLNEKERLVFLRMVESRHARSSAQREFAENWLKENQERRGFSQVSMDRFRLISDWYHFATLELSAIPGFRQDIRWIARSLGIPLVEARKAVKRLFRLNFLREADGRWKAAEDLVFAGWGVPSAGIRRFHSQLLHKAEKALFFQPIDEREFGSWIISIDPKEIPEAKLMIQAFHREFCQRFGRRGAPPSAKTHDLVYCLSTQFYSLMAGSRRDQG